MSENGVFLGAISFPPPSPPPSLQFALCTSGAGNITRRRGEGRKSWGEEAGTSVSNFYQRDEVGGEFDFFFPLFSFLFVHVCPSFSSFLTLLQLAGNILIAQAEPF
jgi:hypothetical protein